MDWINITLIFGIVTVITYATFTALLIGRLPVSLSETYYALPIKLRVLFPAVLIVAAVTLLPIWLDSTAGLWYQFLVFIACVATIFVAFSPKYREGLERKVHFTAATVACVSITMYHIFNGTWLVLLVCFIPTLVAYFWRYKDNVSLFAELSFISSVYLTLI